MRCCSIIGCRLTGWVEGGVEHWNLSERREYIKTDDALYADTVLRVSMMIICVFCWLEQDFSLLISSPPNVRVDGNSGCLPLFLQRRVDQSSALI
jgi:hypothetical protein